MYIKLGTIKANRLYDEPNDFIILSEVPSSSMSFESPTRVRSLEELNIWFGKTYPEYSYLRELVESGITLYLYKPVSPSYFKDVDLDSFSDQYLDNTEKIEYPSLDILKTIVGKTGEEGIKYHVSGDIYIWYSNSWTSVYSLEQSVNPISKSYENRDTLVITEPVDGIPKCYHPKWKWNQEELRGELDIPQEGTDCQYDAGDGIYASKLLWSGDALGSGCFGFIGNSGEWIICCKGNTEEVNKIRSSNIRHEEVNSISDIIRALGEVYSCTQTSESEWSLVSKNRKDLITFNSFPEIDIEPNQDKEEEILGSIAASSDYISFWSKTIGRDRDDYDLDESRIKVSIEYVGSEGWLIEISRYSYKESWVGPIHGTLEEEGIIAKINRESRLVYCDVSDNIEKLREGSFYLSGAKVEEPTAEWYKHSMIFLGGAFEDSVCPDFFMIPDLSLYGERNDELWFLTYATAGKFQYIISEKGEEYKENYLKDEENWLLYFYGNVLIGEEERPGYYLYLKKLLMDNNQIYNDKDIRYNVSLNQTTPLGNTIHNPYITTDLLDSYKCNYLVSNNQIYYHNKYQNGDNYVTSGTQRFIIGKIYREFEKHKWGIIGQKFNSLIEKRVLQILGNIQEFDIVKKIELGGYYPLPELESLDITIDLVTRELLKNNITLDITINYKKYGN